MAAATPTVHIPDPFNIPQDVAGDIIKPVVSAEASLFERITEVVTGLLLVGIGVAAMLRPTPVGSAVTSGAKTAGKLAAL
jgi:hypothetical protein